MRDRRAFQVKAQGMVEFALILPLLLLVMFAIIEFGRLIFIYSAVFTSSRDAARYGAAAGDIGGYVAHYQDCAGMHAAARRIGNLVGITNSDIYVWYDDGPGTRVVSDNPPYPEDCPVPGTGPADVGLGDRVVVQVSAGYQPILPLVNVPPGGWQIRSRAARTLLKDINIQGTPSAPIASVRVYFATAGSSPPEDDVVVDVRVSINAPYAENVLVDVLVDGASTATPGLDYTYTPGQVMVIAGHTFVDVPITIHEDDLYEGDETVVLTLANPVNAALGAITTHILTIQDDEPPPVISFTSPAQTMDEAGGSTFITVALSDAAGNPVVSGLDASASISVISGTASLGSDFTFNPVGLASVTIPAGQLSADINLTVNDDLLDEDDTEVALIELAAPVNATLGAITQHTLSITDNDLPPVVSFTWATQQGVEGDDVGIQVELRDVLGNPIASGRDVTVPYTYISSPTAAEGADYQMLGASPLVIPHGSVTADILVRLFDENDGIPEPDEAITVTLGAPINADPGVPSIHNLVIVPQMPPPTVYFSSASQTAGEADGTITVDVVLDAAYNQVVSVPFTLGGDAVLGVDYSLTTPSPAVIPAGSASFTIQILLLNDLSDELDEAIILTLVGSPGDADYVLGSPSVHTATIVDDDPMPTVYFINTSQFLDEEAGTIPVTAQLNPVSGKDVTVYFSAGGTATYGSDYTLSPGGSLTIPAGSTQAEININVENDDALGGANIGEGNETVVLTITSADEAIVGTPNVHTATIAAWVCPTVNGFAYDSGDNRLLIWNFAYAGVSTLRLSQVTITWPPGGNTDVTGISFGGSSIGQGSYYPATSGSLAVSLPSPLWSGTFNNRQMIFQLNRHPNGGTTSVSARFDHCQPYNASISN